MHNMYLIPAILHHLLINLLSKSNKKKFSAIFYSHNHAQRILSAMFPTHHIKVFYSNTAPSLKSVIFFLMFDLCKYTNYNISEHLIFWNK